MGIDEQKTQWAQVLDSIKGEAKEPDFFFLDDLEFVKIEGDAAYITVSSNFNRDVIQNRWSSRFAELIEDSFDQPLTLKIEVRETASSATEDSANTAGVTPTASGLKTLQQPGTGHAPSSLLNNINLNSEFTFDTFIPDESTKFAFAVASAVARNPGKSDSNPLFIYGSVGVGKTHLMQAIGNYAHRNPDNKILYLSAENFLNDYIETVAKKGIAMKGFRNKYRNTDILLIDDIHQFKESQTGTQEEFFNTIKELLDKHKQLVFTSDRPARELKFDARTTSRFGIQVSLQMPGVEARCAILRKRAEAVKAIKNIEISNKITDFVSSKISTNVRDLIAVFNTIVNYAELLNEPITLEIAQKQLENYFSSIKLSNISVDLIQRTVADYFSITKTDILSKEHKQNIVHARHLAMYLARELTELSYMEIGGYFNGKNHATVIHACNKIKEKRSHDPQEETTIRELTRIINESTVK